VIYRGGLFVRNKAFLESGACNRKLEFGALIEEVDRDGNWLNYKKVRGNGPPQGWVVSMSADGKRHLSLDDGGVVWAVAGGAARAGVTVTNVESSHNLGTLAVGTTVRELCFHGDMIYYQKVQGEGPSCGWVRVFSAATKELLLEVVDPAPLQLYARHPDNWAAKLVIMPDGHYSRTDNGDWGKWTTVNNTTLILAWKTWDPEVVSSADSGFSFRNEQSFVMESDTFPPLWLWNRQVRESVRCVLNEPPPPAPSQFLVILVPFREQAPLQERHRQLTTFRGHMERFLRSPAVKSMVVVVQQSEDGCKFNRGQLLNAGFDWVRKHFQKHQVQLASVILHDCDLLPPVALRPWYLAPPQRGQPLQLFSPEMCGSAKYGVDKVPRFFGGVTAMHPADFAACNGFPNDLWGWGFEDEELRTRLEIAGTLRKVMQPPPVGVYEDIDSLNIMDMYDEDPENAKRVFVNQYMSDEFTPPLLDCRWQTYNGLGGLAYRVLENDFAVGSSTFEPEDEFPIFRRLVVELARPHKPGVESSVAAQCAPGD